jgi:Cysteine-rich CPXCG
VELLSEELVQCPFCWESFTILVDRSVEHQEYVEDCFICCRPILFDVACDGENITISAERESD